MKGCKWVPQINKYIRDPALLKGTTRERPGDGVRMGQAGRPSSGKNRTQVSEKPPPEKQAKSILHLLSQQFSPTAKQISISWVRRWWPGVWGGCPCGSLNPKGHRAPLQWAASQVETGLPVALIPEAIH